MSQSLPIRVAPAATSVADTSKPVFGSPAAAVNRVAQVPVEALRASLRAVSASFLESLADVAEVGRYRLKEVTVKVEVNAEGGINLIGSASASASGAIELKFIAP